jgi:DNA polymerase-1
MQSYAEQDVEVTVRLFEKLHESMAEQTRRTGGKAWSGNAIELEHLVQVIIDRQERHGFLFDRDAANALVQELAGRRAELDQSLRTLFPPWYRKGKPGVHARSCRVWHADENGTEQRRVKPKGEPAYFVAGYYEEVQKGAEFTRVELRDFNPGSRFDVADRLIKLRGWKPEKFTNDGHPAIDDEVLSDLPWPEAKALAEMFLVDKRLGQIAEGKQAWLKNIDPDGRIRGSAITNGAVTGRMTHKIIVNVPSSRAKYGPECRALFIVPPGKKLVGCDADSLEGRCQAGYLTRYDGGAFMEAILRGDKALGTDTHTLTAKALGLDPKAKVRTLGGKMWPGREVGKKFFYTLIYGSADYGLGLVLGVVGDKAKRAGAKGRRLIMQRFPALAQLIEGVAARVKSCGGLVGLDTRFLRVRKTFAALNTLLQSAGAILMKQALVILDDDLQAAGLVPGVHYEFVANVHDEWQIEVDEEKAEFVGKTAAEAIKKAGEFFNFGCPLAGEPNIGSNWRDTH